MVNVAIIGDVHRYFNEKDVSYFNDSDYDLILFVGDLSDYLPARGVQLARLLARLEKPALFIPGNHDTVSLFQLLAEIKQNRLLVNLFSVGQERREQRLQEALQGVQLCGYSRHPFVFAGHNFDVIAGRPYSMGGSSLNFKPYLQRRYGVDSLEASARLLMKLIDESTSKKLVFLAHNGPHGLGAGRTDIWGCDFLDEEGDYGDRDLTKALEYAFSRGKKVIAVAAGHMHHQLKGGGTRQWLVERQGTNHINAARVPRIFWRDGRYYHHHVRLSFDETNSNVIEMIV